MLLGRLLVGCFDVEQVDGHATATKPDPLLIDDFDDGDRQPALSSLEPWRCFGLNGTVQNVRSDAEQKGAHSTAGRAITYDLVDVSDGQKDYQAGVLQTKASVPLDLTGYERFVFWAALDAEATPDSLPVRITLYCDDLGDGALLQSPDRSVPAGVPFRPYSSLIADFYHPDWVTTDYDVPACLARVSAVGLYLQPEMLDGHRASGRLTVDDAYLQ
jgi:hypothetical protein